MRNRNPSLAFAFAGHEATMSCAWDMALDAAPYAKANARRLAAMYHALIDIARVQS